MTAPLGEAERDRETWSSHHTRMTPENGEMCLQAQGPRGGQQPPEARGKAREIFCLRDSRVIDAGDIWFGTLAF